MNSITSSAILSTAYFPPIQYFQCLHRCHNIYIESLESYKRHSIRNRTLILGANGIILLTVPIKRKSYSKILIKDIKIAHNNWQKKHLNSIKSAYGSSPFFIHYFNEIESIINKKFTFLMDLNYEILNYVLHEISIQKNINETKVYLKKYPLNFLDQREKIEKHTGSKKYQQVFSQKFISNLSIIDLIFNVGPNAKEYIYAS